MPTAYEQSYGEVTFYTLAGTKIYAMVADLGMWLVEDTEPSPDPKWVRVDVPGADGAVDLSRALAGQVTYEPRKVALRFAGKKADHATALTTIRNLRKALHGARVKVETMLTKLSSGYYIADCECDGEAHTDGAIEVAVTCVCDPFIRTGTQTLALAGSTTHQTADAFTVASPAAGLLVGAGSIGARYSLGTAYFKAPTMATTARLLWARGANLIDPSQMTVRAWRSSDGWSSHDEHAATVNGQAVNLGSIDSARSYYVDLMSSPVKGQSIGKTSLPYFAVGTSPARSATLAVYLSGTVTGVSDPAISFLNGKGVSVASDGFANSGNFGGWSGTVVSVPSVGSYDVELVKYCTVQKGSFTTQDSESWQLARIKIDGITGTDVIISLALLDGAVTPGAWEPADLGSATIDFGGRFYGSYSADLSDEATIKSSGEVVTTHHFSTTSTSAVPISPPVTTYGTIDGWPPADATNLCLSVIDQYGGECATTLLSADYADVATATATNTTMRSIPSITSTGGAYVEIDGRTSIVGAGTVELQGLTIPGGAFSVGYATLDGASATLTWEGGVL